MNLKDFDYELPEELIAQHPLEDRSSSRLLVLDREKDTVEHKSFTDIISYLNEGDTLVLNDTRVLPARIYGHREDKDEKIEFLLIKELEKDQWECLVKPGKKAKLGQKIIFKEGLLEAEVIDITEEGSRIMHFTYEGIFLEALNELGEMPIPPYIHEKLENQERYQTVYSKHVGSAAAPTAGLHFTEDLMKEIKDMGVNIEYVTLHVGLGTFSPVRVDDIEEHKMHSEYFNIPKKTVDTILETKKLGKRVYAVGTTSARTLESAFDDKLNEIRESGWTDIFIYPGYKFKVVDNLITNFHLPESTLMMLVSALAGRDKIMNAYKIAVEEKYRFFSFGDAMLIK